jgi:hypothetical protein
VNNDPILWAMLNAIQEQPKPIQQQQEQIMELGGKIGMLKAALRMTPSAKLAKLRAGMETRAAEISPVNSTAGK